MATAVKDRPQASRVMAAAAPSDRSIAQIIEQARTAPAPIVGAFAVSLASAVMLWASFFPLNWGPLAWVAPVPLLLLVRVERRTKWMYRSVCLAALCGWMLSLQWMRLGHIMMVPLWILLALYLALYVPLFVAVTRLAVLRLHVPLALAAPVVWVSLEYLRTHLMSGFGWYLLGHSQHEWTSLVQISDLTGAYGVSFVVMLSAAALAECVPPSWFARLRLLPPVDGGESSVARPSIRRVSLSVAASVVAVAVAWAYGEQRLDHAEFAAGPRVGLIQGDFRSEIKHDPNEASRIYMQHFQLTGQTVPYRPDVVIWPETMFPYPLLLADEGLSDADLRRLHPHIPPKLWRDPQMDVRPVLRDRAEQAGAALILGIDTREATAAGGTHYNSAVFVQPGVGISGRYDKLHLVPFGEYLPLKEWLPFLGQLSPFGE
jgi:apolipoprotein N-acyltransferase